MSILNDLILIKFFTQLPLVNTPRLVGRIFNFFLDSNFRAPPHLGFFINLVAFVNSGINIALMFFKASQINYLVIKRILGVQ